MTGTRVFVARVGRQTKTREYKDLEAHFTAHLGYSHHQKAVIVDAPIEDHIGSYTYLSRMASNICNGYNLSSILWNGFN